MMSEGHGRARVGQMSGTGRLGLSAGPVPNQRAYGLQRTKVHPLLWAYLGGLAIDRRRVQILSATQAVVWNHPGQTSPTPPH